MAMGRLDEAVAEMKRALELDPLFALNHYLLARALSAAGRYEEALREYDEAVALGGGPRIYATHRRVAIAYERTGREREAITELVAALRAVNENRSLRAEDLAALVERKYASFGYSEAKRVFLRGDALHVAPKLGPIWMVLDYAELGEMDKAFEQLDKAIQQRNSNMRYIKVDERLVLLRSDPRFQDLVRSIGLPP